MAKKIYIVQAGFLPVGASDVTGWRSHSFYAGRRAYDGAVAEYEKRLGRISTRSGGSVWSVLRIAAAKIPTPTSAGLRAVQKHSKGGKNMTVLERLKAAGYDPAKAITHYLTAGTGEMECARIAINTFRGLP